MEKTLFEQIRDLVKQIPKGKVTTYGAIAKKLGLKDSRKVGWAIYGNQDAEIPCHRVVNKDGFVAEKFSLGGWMEHKLRLLKDGVTFSDEKKVDLDKHLYTYP